MNERTDQLTPHGAMPVGQGQTNNKDMTHVQPVYTPHNTGTTALLARTGWVIDPCIPQPTAYTSTGPPEVVRLASWVVIWATGEKF